MLKILPILLLGAVSALADGPCPTCITDPGCLGCHNPENVGQFCDCGREPGFCWNCCTACIPCDTLSASAKQKLRDEGAARAKKFYADPLSGYGKLVASMLHTQKLQDSVIPRTTRMQLIHERISPRVGFIFNHREAPKSAEGRLVLDQLAHGLDLRTAEARYR